ncbi:MAG: family 4 glycosyl hydrolase [bacterium]
MPKPKIVIIGGGSLNWTHTIVQDIVLTEALQGSQIVLQDINPKPLELTHKVGARIIEEAKSSCTIDSTTDRRRALEGADFVILTISTGGFETMQHDLAIPEKYGIYQSVGDTVGPGGISRALRNIPVVVDICRDMEELCPEAWLINYTNPMTTLCRAATKATKIKTIGLCHELFGTLAMLSRALGVEEKEIQVRAAGVNHLLWITELRVRGKDGFPALREFIERNPRFEPPSDMPIERRVFFDTCALKFELFKLYGALPAAGDRHLAEFFPNFLTEENDRGMKYGVALTTIEHRRKNMERAEEMNRRMLREPISLVRSREEASAIIASLLTGRESEHIVNVPNRGEISNLPRDAVVEIMAFVGALGVRGALVGDLPKPVARVLHTHVINQELTVEAALSGDRNLALQAFLGDPLTEHLSVSRARKMMDELIEANMEYLPQFR